MSSSTTYNDPESLRTRDWPDGCFTSDPDLLRAFYEPALACSRTYDRAVGYFRSSFYALTAPAVAAFALREMEAQGLFARQMDGYRLAIANDLDPSEQRSADRENMYNMGSVDPDSEIRLFLRQIYPDAADWPNRAAESLAEQEQGVELMAKHEVGGSYWLATMCPTTSKGDD